ncbi:MAG TPA: glutamate 5-kinase [Actinomycetota bacterium]|nr:glutamate 5-kinase [Actinomycetota bacterium]
MTNPIKPKLVVVKIGTTSLVSADGEPDRAKLKGLTKQIAAIHRQGVMPVIVSSGAIAAGLAPLRMKKRPTDMPSLQAAAAVGQTRLMDLYADLLKPVPVGQVLLTQQDIVNRRSYLNARNTLKRLIDLGCIPIVNENDTVAVEEIRYGDNDRLAALVAHIVQADLLVMLSDVEGLYDGDPKRPGAKLIGLVEQIDTDILRYAKGGSALGSGGMASKLEAARMAAFSGISAVIASSDRRDALIDIVAGKQVGTVFAARPSKVQARKLWIAWAPAARGRIIVDPGAVDALTHGKKSLLAAGVRSVEGSFAAGDAVEVTNDDGVVFAKGLVGYDSHILSDMAGKSGGFEVINRDRLVVL